MTEQLQTHVEQPALVDSKEPQPFSSITGSASHDAPSELIPLPPSSDTPVPIPTVVAPGIVPSPNDTPVVECDESNVNLSSLQPEPSAHLTPSSAMASTLEPPLVLSPSVAPEAPAIGADHAEAVLSPAEPSHPQSGPVESGPLTSDQVSPLSEDRNISNALIPESVSSAPQPSLPADSTQVTAQLAQSSSSPGAEPIRSTAEDTASQTPLQPTPDLVVELPSDPQLNSNDNDRPVASSIITSIDNSICDRQVVPKPSSATESSAQLPHSSPTPTTSTFLPSPAHDNSDRGSEQPTPSISNPTYAAHSPRPPPNVLPPIDVTEPFNSQQNQAQTTSSLSSPLSPIEKRPESPSSAQDFNQSNGALPHRHLNGNGPSLPTENGHKRPRLDGESLIQDPPTVNPPSQLAYPTQSSSSLASQPPHVTSAPQLQHVFPTVTSTAMSTESQTHWIVPGTPGSSFTREQHRFASSVLKQLKKHRSAQPFLHPVDVVKLQIPDYLNIIKHPMDLTTVETRLGKSSKPSFYKSAEQFIADVQLIFTNCYAYNGAPDVAHISHMALELSMQFDSQMKKLPSDEPVAHYSSRSPSLYKPKAYSVPGPNTTASAGVKRKISSPGASSMAASTSGPTGQKRRSASPQQGRKKATKTNAHSTPAGAYQADGAFSTAAARRNSMAAETSGSRSRDTKDKQPVHDGYIPEHVPAPKTKRKSTAPAPQVMVSNSKEELKFCKELLREVNKKAYEKFVWPFYEPVDPVKLGIPEYFDKIKRPMDLSTIKSKLDRGDYKSGAAFAADFRLMLNNCFAFNPPATPVHNFGRQLEKLFEAKWHERPPDVIPAPQPAPTTIQETEEQRIAALHQIALDMARLQERLDHETARTDILMTPAPPIVTGPTGKKQSSSKAATAAKNLANINTASTASSFAAPQSTARKTNGGAKGKGGGRKKSVTGAAAGAQTAVAGQRQIQQQLQERAQHHSQLHQQQQAASAAASIFAPGAQVPAYHNPSSLPSHNESDYYERIDYEQKKDLANMIQNAVEPMQSEAINLIRNAHPDLVTAEGEEIELDIDALDDRTLYRLYQLVCTDPPPAPPAPPKKKKAAPKPKATGAANGKTTAPKKKAPPRKGIDENQETARIKELESRLHSFPPTVTPSQPPTFAAPVSAGPGIPTGVPPPAGPVEYASSSSESESDSDDESD